MGLQDILNGMQNGPRGQRPPSSGGSGGGGMSPITMALLGLLAYKALKGSGGLGNIFGGGQPATPGNAARPAGLPGGQLDAGNSGGGLGGLLGSLFGGRSAVPAGARPGGSLSDMIPGGLGGLLGGATAGSVLSGGLGNLIKDLQNSGHGQAAQSWVGTGPNREIAPNELADALGSDTLDTLSQQTGMGRDDLLTGLSQQLPRLVDQLTPDGRLPTAEEASRLV
jgi:uncharacterized protein YidB (DUF937 family)